MGLRFRKSMKIMPGVRVNLSASGVSTTLGARGASVSIGERGVYANTGIPGTGLSFRERLDKSNKRISSKTASRDVVFSEVSLSLNDNGTIQYIDTDTGSELNRSDVTYFWNNYSGIISKWLQERINEINDDEEISNIHYTMSRPSSTSPKFRPIEYSIEAPVEPAIPSVPPLSWLSKLLFKKRVIAHKQQIEKLDTEYLYAMRQWTTDMEDWTKGYEQHKKTQEDVERNFNNLIRSDLSFMETHLESVLDTMSWPRETLISYEISEDMTKLCLDVDLPEIEDLPMRVASLASTGKKANIKNKTQKQQRLDYARHVHGIALKLSATALSELPSLNNVLISGYSQRLNEAIGKIQDDYLFSILFTRDSIEELNFEHPEHINPIEAVENFEHIRKMTTTGAFKAIVPLGKTGE